MLLVKLIVLVVAWTLAWIPGLAALALWRAYGGHLAAPEIATVLAGHFLRAALTCAIAIAAAALTDNAATAAVVTLAVTLGTWALDFVAQVHGGLAVALDAFTPESALRTFESGELRLSLVLVTLVLTAGALLLAWVWLPPSRTRRQRILWTLPIVAGTALLVVGAAQLRQSWDFSEDRRNSFAPADERALSSIRQPLRVSVFLAPEDPRLADLQRGVFKKLQRTMHDVDISYQDAGSGLFARPGDHYGEVWYALGTRRAMNRSTTEPIILETIYGLAGITPPANDPASAYPGHPLAVSPRGAALIFYLGWPLLVIGVWWLTRQTRRPKTL